MDPLTGFLAVLGLWMGASRLEQGAKTQQKQQQILEAHATTQAKLDEVKHQRDVAIRKRESAVFKHQRLNQQRLSAARHLKQQAAEDRRRSFLQEEADAKAAFIANQKTYWDNKQQEPTQLDLFTLGA